MWPFPCPWMPATPTRITSLAPSTRPDALVPAIVTSGNTEPAAAARLRKLRRVILFMRLSCGGEGRHPRLVLERIAYYWRQGRGSARKNRNESLWIGTCKRPAPRSELLAWSTDKAHSPTARNRASDMFRGLTIVFVLLLSTVSSLPAADGEDVSALLKQIKAVGKEEGASRAARRAW